MSETPDAGAAPQVNGAPIFRVAHQYLKDLSFESPSAPQSLLPEQAQPSMDVSVDVGARKLNDDGQYEVEIACNATATRNGQPMFVVECNYAGLFIAQNIPDEQLEIALLVEAPRMLFPFARGIIANATRDGGFLPLMLEPLDFGRMYQAQKAQAAAAGSNEGPPNIGTA